MGFLLCCQLTRFITWGKWRTPGDGGIVRGREVGGPDDKGDRGDLGDLTLTGGC